MNILVLNVGSSSLKFQLVDTDAARIEGDGDRRLARGQIERIGGAAVWSFRAGDGPSTRGSVPLRDHRAAVEYLLAWLVSDGSGVEIHSLADIGAVGHRVVHGGEAFVRSVAIDEAVTRRHPGNHRAGAPAQPCQPQGRGGRPRRAGAGRAAGGRL